jgi:hypothetical protein
MCQLTLQGGYMPNKNLNLYEAEEPDGCLFLPQEYYENLQNTQAIPTDWEELGFSCPKARINLNSPKKYLLGTNKFLEDSPEHSIQDIWRIDVSAEVLEYLEDLRSKECNILYLKTVAVLKKLASEKVPPLKLTHSKEPVLYLYCKSISMQELLKAFFNHREKTNYIHELSNYLFIGFNTLELPNSIRGKYAWMLHHNLDLTNREDQNLYRKLSGRTPVHLIHKICELGVDRFFAHDMCKFTREIDLTTVTARAYDAINYGPAKLAAERKASTPKSSQEFRGKGKPSRKQRSVQRKASREQQPPKKQRKDGQVSIESLFNSKNSQCNQPAKTAWPKTPENKQMIKNVS